MTIPYQIKATTLAGLRREFVEWLKDQSVEVATEARMKREVKGNPAMELAYAYKAHAYIDAAVFWLQATLPPTQEPPK